MRSLNHRVLVLIGKTPLVCGTARAGITDCYKFDPICNEWFLVGEQPYGLMESAASNGAFQVHPTRGLFMPGGTWPRNFQQRKVRSTLDGINFDTNYPDLLQDVYGACQVIL